MWRPLCGVMWHLLGVPCVIFYWPKWWPKSVKNEWHVSCSSFATCPRWCKQYWLFSLTFVSFTKTLTSHIFFIRCRIEVSFAPLEISWRALRLGAIFAEIWGLQIFGILDTPRSFLSTKKILDHQIHYQSTYRWGNCSLTFPFSIHHFFSWMCSFKAHSKIFNITPALSPCPSIQDDMFLQLIHVLRIKIIS